MSASDYARWRAAAPSQDSALIRYKPARVFHTRLIKVAVLIRYKPARVFHTRLIKVAKTAEDPMQPPRFRYRKIPRAAGRDSDFAPVTHSPPRPLTAEDMKNWKVPPCVSSWKNHKGYAIPLDKRRNADEWECEISRRFAELAEALYVAEEAARESVALRNKIQREWEMKEKERRDEDLRELARKARHSAVGRENSNNAGVLEEWRNEKARKRRLEAKEEMIMKKKKKKMSRGDRDRDISERIALGLASAGRRNGVLTFDLRLVDQEKGLDSGFAAGDGDRYNVYDKRLFTAQSSAFSALFRHARDEYVVRDEEEELEKITGDARCRKSRKAFPGATKPRDRPQEDQDFFGLDEFLSKLRH